MTRNEQASSSSNGFNMPHETRYLRIHPRITVRWASLFVVLCLSSRSFFIELAVFRHDDVTRDGVALIQNKEKQRVDAKSLKITYSKTKQQLQDTPPQGYPWYLELPHHQRMNVSALTDVFATEINNIKCLDQFQNLVPEEDETNPDILLCWYHLHTLPYIVKNGTIFKSKAKESMLLKYKNRVTSRIHAFDQMLDMAMMLARQSSNARLRRIASLEALPIILFKGDAIPYHIPNNVPVLSWLNHFDDIDRNDTNVWPIPSYHLWRKAVSKDSASEWKKQFQTWRREYPWSKKKRRAVWRGSPTGPFHWHWKDLPRARLVHYGMQRRDLFNVGFTKARNPQEHAEMLNSTEVQFRKRMNQDDFMRYMAIVDMDGNSWSSRFGHLLCYNSVIIKVRPKFVDYFHSELVPWKHYIPVHANLSNLVDVTEYALDKNNTREVLQIIENANRWCKRKLVRKQLATDFLWILVAYAELLENSNPE